MQELFKTMRIDAHQHFWKYDPALYPWMRPDWPIRRDFLPADLEPLLRKAKLDGCVAVQARQSIEEGRWLLSLTAQYSFIKGVVGWIDLRDPDVDQQLNAFANHPRFVGVRHVVQDEPDDEFMLHREFVRGISQLRDFDLAYDILIYPRQLPAAIRLVRKFPQQRFVLDHIAKPLVKAGVISPWREQIRELAMAPNVYCKISGMITEADWKKWKVADFAPYLDVVFGAFGADRLIYGSDWPVCLLAGSYERVYDLAAKYCRQLSPSEQQLVFGKTAARFYRL
jgi:L-fuconolactonase